MADTDAEMKQVFDDYKAAEPIPLLVYHYTSLPAFINIVQSGIIWCSNVQFSNDPAEISYAHDLIRSVLAQAYPAFAFGGVFQIIQQIDYYAAAFSAVKDSLPQWRAYCSNGRGVALGFKSAVFQQHPDLIFGRVEYNRSRQEALVRRVLQIYVPRIQAAPNQQARLPPVQGLAEAFVKISGLLKDEAYESEHEYRAYVTQPRPVQYHTFPPQFRATQTSVVPYLEFSWVFQNVPAPLSEVVIGPCLDPALTNPSIEAFVEQVLQPPPTVSNSAVKMRP
jgi:DUF2971 family protein